MRYVDSHCHIDGPEFDADRDGVIQRARSRGVAAMVNIGTGDPSTDAFERAVEVANRYEGVYAAVGVHPHDAKLYDDAAEAKLTSLCQQNPKVIAWGEIGLDYYYDHSPRDVQRDVFRRQMQTARNLGLPIVVHSRDADDETVDLVREESSAGEIRGIMHCFGGTPTMAESMIELGFMISFAGNVTFKKAENLREAARVVPLDRLLIETDCPFLAPVPNRGKRNEPSFVVDTANFLSDLYQVDATELGERTTQNFEKFFGIKV